jgi:hypothetical protein
MSYCVLQSGSVVRVMTRKHNKKVCITLESKMVSTEGKVAQETPGSQNGVTVNLIVVNCDFVICQTGALKI